MWPHNDAVAQRAAQLIGDYRKGLDIAKFTTTGTEDKRVEVKKAKAPSKTTGSAATFKSSKENKQSSAKLAEPEPPLRTEQPKPKEEVKAPKEEPKPVPKEEPKPV